MAHDLPTLIHTLNRVKNINNPVLLHIITKKGKGYKYAEEDTTGVGTEFHHLISKTGNRLLQRKDYDN